MPDDPYGLADLARLAGVTPRTVRYYVAQGLLPSPESAGPATRYGEGHLARLRLIRRLQRDHLPLAGIRARLEKMDDAAVTAALELAEPGEPEPPAEPGDTLAYVRGLMARAGVQPAGGPARAPAAPHPLRAIQVDLRTAPVAAAQAAPPAMALPVNQVASTTDRTTWERLAITPDIEIHVRRPLDRQSNKRVEQLARIARELFEDEP